MIGAEGGGRLVGACGAAPHMRLTCPSGARETHMQLSRSVLRMIRYGTVRWFCNRAKKECVIDHQCDALNA